MNKEQQKIEVGKCVCSLYGNCELDRIECPYSDCFADAVATEVIDKGYRKVDDKLCLKHGEKDYYLTEEDAKDEKACEDCQKQARQETAKEIFNKLIKTAEEFNGLLPFWALKAWALEYGVEIE